MDAIKRFSTVLLAFLVIISLSGCDGVDGQTSIADAQSAENSTTDSPVLREAVTLPAQQPAQGESAVVVQEPIEVEASTFIDDYMPPTEPAASGSCGNDVYWALDDGGVLTIYGNGDMWDYSNNGPWTYNFNRVVIRDGITSIGDHAFDNCPASSYLIGSRVRRIGERAFYSCNMTDVILPDALEEIDSEAFLSCWVLGSITIPKNVEYIGPSAFTSSQKLQAINVDANNPYYVSDGGILFNKDKTELVCIPQGLSSRMMQYDIPRGVVKIADGALKFAKFKMVSIPDTVTEIGSFSFAYCSNIKAITMPQSVTSVAPYAFYYCRNLEGVTISPNLIAISDGMFEECENLTNVIVPSGVVSIGRQSFRRCRSLVSISIPQSVGSIGDFAFETAKLDSIYYEGSEAAWNQIAMDLRNNSILTRTQIYYASGSENVPQISEAELNDPYSGRCNLDIRWRYDGNGTLTISGNGKMNDYNSDTKPEWKEYINSITSVVVEDGVTYIGSQAFFDHPQLQHITIAGGVNLIGSEAISRCGNITEIVIPEGTTRLTMWAIFGCNSLKTAYLPSTITDVYQCFKNNYALTDIYYNGTENQWDQLDFGFDAFTFGVTVHFSDGSVVQKGSNGH